MNLDRRAFLLLGFACLAPGGCNPGSPYEHATVRGTVTYQGKPVTFGSVLFLPVVEPKDGQLQPASGSINPDGTYELKSESDAGAILGDHKVLVIAVDGSKSIAPPAAAPKVGDPAPTPGVAQFKSAIPKKYSDPSMTTLVRKVVPGQNTINIELTD